MSHQYLSPRQFYFILNAKEDGSDDAVLKQVIVLPDRSNRKGQSQSQSQYEQRMALHQDRRDPSRLQNTLIEPEWYQKASEEDKEYALLKMQCISFHTLDDDIDCKATRSNIIMRFTEDDFHAVLDQNISRESIIEIAKRTRGSSMEERKKEIKAMKKRIWRGGGVKQRLIQRLNEEAIRKDGYEQRSIEELESFIRSKLNP